MKAAANGSDAKQSLTAEDWARAALDVMAAGGLDAVAVEPLARRLGVTKGSFYWHFANREALLRAALELWERRETEEVLARVGDESDPYARIVKVFKEADAGYRSGRLYLAIAAAEDNPLVREFVQRVSERRMAYLLQCYEALGFDAPRAQHWARFAYATFMGNLQIRRDTPDLMPGGAPFNEYLKLMIKTLIPRSVGDLGADSEGEGSSFASAGGTRIDPERPAMDGRAGDARTEHRFARDGERALKAARRPNGLNMEKSA